MGDSAIGIDLGATNIKAGLVDQGGQIVKELRRETRAAEGVDAVVAAICEVGRALRSIGTPSCMGVGLPGLVDPESGVVRIPPNLPGWEEVPLKQLLHDTFRTPVFVANDVNMVTYGEWRFGAGKGIDDLLVVTLGSGVGGGMVVGGRLYLGAHGLAGEIGHTTVEPSGPRCNCGNYGCLETFVGAEYVKAKAITLINKGVKSQIRQLVAGDLNSITPEVISRAAAKADDLAHKILMEMGTYLGIALANAISLLDPRRVVIGGGIAKAGQPLFHPLRETIRERLYSYRYTKVEVVPAQLGDSAGVIGAATYAMSQLKD